MATQTDPGKLMQAKLPGTCAECGGDIQPRDTIYFSRLLGSRHKRCVDPGEPAAAPDERAAPRAAARDGGSPARDGSAARDDGWLWADGPATPPAARGEYECGPRPAADDARRDATRATEFGRAGDRDAARGELGQVLDLLIDALTKIRKLLA